jgi:hypothetical protein
VVKTRLCFKLNYLEMEARRGFESCPVGSWNVLLRPHTTRDGIGRVKPVSNTIALSWGDEQCHSFF